MLSIVLTFNDGSTKRYDSRGRNCGRTNSLSVSYEIGFVVIQLENGGRVTHPAGSVAEIREEPYQRY